MIGDIVNKLCDLFDHPSQATSSANEVWIDDECRIDGVRLIIALLQFIQALTVCFTVLVFLVVINVLDGIGFFTHAVWPIRLYAFILIIAALSIQGKPQ